MSKNKERLDVLLVERGLCESRQQAQRVIRAGEVRVAGAIADKPGTAIARDADIAVTTRPQFVSRGGDKLARALVAFGIEPGDRVCLDGGISTGGFTDCLLQAGARRVYGVDVGYGQVAWSLRQDPRVILRERCNLRQLQPADLYGESGENGGDEDLAIADWPDLGVVDVSFIGLAKVLPALWRLLTGRRELVLLVKPQFEVGRDRVGKKGVVRDAHDRAGAIAQVIDTAIALGWHYCGVVPSPLPGPAGNVEYLLWLQAGDVGPTEAPDAARLLAIAQQDPAVATPDLARDRAPNAS